MKKIIISDATLRDGNHAVQHQLTKKQVATYAKAADNAGVNIVEVGHGNGIGASSMLVGQAKETDVVLLETARENLKNSKLGIHIIPGFATIENDLKSAISIGVDVFRVASHCTEANVTEKHIDYCRSEGKEVYGVLMMSHMAPVDVLVEEALKMESYGADAVIIMDSAGYYLPSDVNERVTALRNALQVYIGFHGHNNMGMAVANSIEAVKCGAVMIDGCILGFGAGSGNTQLEVLVAVLQRLGYKTDIDLYKILDAADIAKKDVVPAIPTISTNSIVSGMAGVFSGFLKRVDKVAAEYKVDPRDVFFELGKRKAIAGQEDLIVEVALELVKKK